MDTPLLLLPLFASPAQNETVDPAAPKVPCVLKTNTRENSGWQYCIEATGPEIGRAHV